ncbi:Presenilin-like protein [Platanthera guangdongensis]|uniref:Presenilin n=1 Tax=Platanthera guangdongensis TaxID=2320717 RepID=A0ABR2MBC5_9ASPA
MYAPRCRPRLRPLPAIILLRFLFFPSHRRNPRLPRIPLRSPAEKLVGALLNAAVFVALVTAVTFLLVLLYYYNFTGFLKAYMRFSAFFVLASMGGSILISFLRRFSLPLDAPSALLLIFNFSVIGFLSVFSNAVPILVRQSYMVALAIIVAAWFTKLPEWTTWILLVALAIYDLAAVLCPRGPLRILLNLASSRDEELPALIYESRPTISLVSSERGRDQPESSWSDLSSSLGFSEQDNELESTRGIRLGLGDFIFYSVLVGRAAMYDLMTVYACFIAILSGLGFTLILLSIYRHALPALPISITLGVVFYFLTRLVLEPFVVGASMSLVMF